MPDQMGSKSGPKMRSKNNNTATPSRPRPKTIHVDAGSSDAYTPRTITSSRGKRGSGNNLTGFLRLLFSIVWSNWFVILIGLFTENRNDSRGDGVRGSNPTLSRRGSNSSLHGGKSSCRLIDDGLTRFYFSSLFGFDFDLNSFQRFARNSFVLFVFRL